MIFFIPDTTKDSRFQENPLVTGDPNLRFYAGALLMDGDGFPLGTLCVLDYEPRELNERQIFALQALARQVMSQIELRRALKEKQRIANKVELAFESPEFTGFWSWNLETNLLMSEPRFAEMYGVDPIWAAQGAPLEEYIKNIDPEDLIRITPSIERTINEGVSYDEEYRLNLADGSVRWVVARGNAHLNDQGKPIRFDGVFIDITERKKSELKLIDKDISLRTALQAGRMETWDLDVDTATLTCSDTCNTNYGLLSGEELSYAKIASLLHPDDVDFWKGTVENAIATAEDFEMEYRIIWADKSLHWIYVRGNCTATSEGKAKKLSGVSIDITPRKMLEAVALEAQQNAEAANIAKTEFLANMSHEIRTPMNAVVGISEILSRSDGLTNKQKELVDTLQISADSLLNLINDLLDVSKIEARSVELEHIPFNLSQIIDEVISIMSLRAREKRIEFKSITSTHTQHSFVGDPTRLRQIIMNLCSNAIKFTENGGVYIHFSTEDSKDANIQNVSITVTDTGIGIPLDMQKNIFNKFIQADSSINRKYGGTGLGLTITKTLTEIMGGTICLKSEINKGTSFVVTLPLLAAENVVLFKSHLSHENDSTPSSITENSVLMIEDNIGNILVAETYLEEFGYRCDIANNGQEGFEKAKSGNYFAILMDVQMPGMSGYDATHLIREYEKQTGKPRTPILGMTAFALSGDRERCLVAGMDDYLSKPYAPEELRLKLASYIQLHKVKSQ